MAPRTNITNTAASTPRAPLGRPSNLMCIIQHDNPEPSDVIEIEIDRIPKKISYTDEAISLIASFGAFTLSVYHLISGSDTGFSCVSFKCASIYSVPFWYWTSMGAVAGFALTSVAVFVLGVRTLSRARRNDIYR
jgi:hypothetical protein